MKKVSLKKKAKKEEKSKKFVGKGLKIVDEDSFSTAFKPLSDSDDEEAEDLPQIAAVVDERPIEVQVLESFNKGKWKRLDDDKKEESNSTSYSNKAESSRSRKHSSSPSHSPSRHRNRSIEISPPRQRRRNNSGSDISPPRRRQSRDSNAASPPRQQKSQVSSRRRRDSRTPPKQRRRNDSDDLSPPRPNRSKSSRDATPPRQRRRHDSDDLSPPRPNRSKSSRDATSPRQRRRHDSDDFSPPRPNRSKSSRDATSPKGRRRRHDSDDLSPPRPNRSKSSRDTTPPRQKRSRGASDDVSPPRRRDVSPRNADFKKRDRDRYLARPEIIDDTDDKKSTTTLDGKKAGLQKATALRDEMLEFRKRENEIFETLPDEVSGRNATAVKRDRRTEEDLVKEAEKERKEAERKAQYDKWGKGLKQVEEREERVRSALHEMAKPMARHKDDEDLDDHLKHQDRDGDPMLEYLAAKRRKARREPEKPKYSGPPPPPNRFNIPPGYRWDGVDRSNGYEKQWFGRINAKKALEEEAYKWSVEDL